MKNHQINRKQKIKFLFLKLLISFLKKIKPPQFVLQIDEETKQLIENNKQIIFVADHSDLLIILLYLLFENKENILFDINRSCTMTSGSQEGSAVNYFLSEKGICCITRKSLQLGDAGTASRSNSFRKLLTLFQREKQFLLMALNEKGENKSSIYSHSSVIASRFTKATLVPISCSSKIDLCLNKNWDRMKIPLGKKFIIVGSPLQVQDCEWSKKRENCTQKFLHIFKKLELKNLLAIKQ